MFPAAIFFEMVDHYLQLMKIIESELTSKSEFDEIRPYLEMNNCSIGMKHVRKLYKASILLYYDRFHEFDPLALKKLFMWAFMLRIELNNLSFDSINKYAIGDGIFNNKPVFSMITQARKHTEIGNTIINIPNSKELSYNNCVEERQMLHELLTNMKHKGF